MNTNAHLHSDVVQKKRNGIDGKSAHMLCKMHTVLIYIYISQQDAHVTEFILSDRQLLYKFRESLSPIFRSPKHVQQLSDKINSVTCASCWDLYIRILLRCTDP